MDLVAQLMIAMTLMQMFNPLALGSKIQTTMVTALHRTHKNHVHNPMDLQVSQGIVMNPIQTSIPVLLSSVMMGLI